jgi:hypothetical protein
MHAMQIVCKVGIGTERHMQASKADKHPPTTHATGDNSLYDMSFTVHLDGNHGVR